jgi:hypothetical protein
MTALRTTLCLISLVGVSGFSTAPQTACEHVASSSARLNQKIGSCAGDVALPFDLSACQASTRACTAGDRATIDQFLDCVDGLPACGGGDGSELRAQLEGCGAGARLSPGCSL